MVTGVIFYLLHVSCVNSVKVLTSFHKTSILNQNEFEWSFMLIFQIFI
jgi:hypothetical protein